MEPWVWIIVAVVVVVIVLFATRRIVTDAQIRRQGTETTGKIVRKDVVRTTDMYGGVHITNYITYDFTDQVGVRRTKRKKVGTRFDMLAEGDDVKVYYLPQRPDKNTLG